MTFRRGETAALSVGKISGPVTATLLVLLNVKEQAGVSPWGRGSKTLVRDERRVYSLCPVRVKKNQPLCFPSSNVIENGPPIYGYENWPPFCFGASKIVNPNCQRIWSVKT